MRQELITELLRAILQIVGEETVTLRREYDKDGNTGILILIGITEPADK